MSDKLTSALKNFLRRAFYNEKLTCAACGADVFADSYFCGHCLKTLPFNGGSVCSKCGRRIADDYPVCLECKAVMPAYTRARSAFCYEGEIVRLVKNFKSGKPYLAGAFAEAMIPVLQKNFADADFAVFVPMTASAQKKRGYNQSELLAERVCGEAGVPLERGVISKTRETGEQKELSRKERAENLKGSFHVRERKKCAGKKILIVDDVMTTGATADALAAPLFGAGAAAVYLLTAASVPAKDENKVK